MGAVRDAARHLRHTTGVALGDADLLAGAHVARPTIRVDDPVTELADRLATLRLAAWQLAAHTEASVTSLAKIAEIAVRVHATLARVREPEPAPGQDLPVGPATGVTPGQAAPWRQVRLHLRQLRTLAPASPATDAFTADTRNLLAALAPEGRLAPGLDDAEQQRLETILVRGTEMLGEIAGWNAATVQRLAAAGQLYLPARTLTGDQVTDRPDLAAAKLLKSHVLARSEYVHPLVMAYTAAANEAAALRRGAPDPAAARAIHGQPERNRGPPAHAQSRRSTTPRATAGVSSSWLATVRIGVPSRPALAGASLA